MNRNAALGFGVFSMATNFTTLAILVPAAKEIAASGIDLVERLVVALVLVVLASMPLWIPVALASVSPGRAERALRALGRIIAEHGRLVSVILIAGIGAFLVVRGVARAVA